MLEDVRDSGIGFGRGPEADHEGSVGVFICDIHYFCTGLVVHKAVYGGSDHVEVTDFLNGESVDFQSLCGHLLSVVDLVDRLRENSGTENKEDHHEG